MIVTRLAEIRRRIDAACRRAGRDPRQVRLLAVSKRQDEARVRAAVAAGQRLFGENYLQEAAARIARFGRGELSWHFIGHLQSNKAAQAAELFDMVETVDRVRIMAALDKRCGALGRTLDILLQVNVGREGQKSGVLPEEAEELARAAAQFPALRLRGLMTMPPFADEPEASRPHFRALAELAGELRPLFADPGHIELSMGMSADFEIAVEEGATIVRVGTLLFGER
ncbi:MAG: YggS family pyridoxal phosphate-dependent enzyme [Thermodesulfobacteriota bacterium]